MPSVPLQNQQPDRTAAPTTVADAFVSQYPRLLAFVERRVRNRTTAEDFLHESFVRALGALRSPPESVTRWLYRTLRNAIIDYGRQQRTARRRLDALAAETSPPTEPSAAPARVCPCVRGALAGLKPEYAVALRRVEIDGLRVRDYAAEADLTPGSAAVRLFRARAALERALNRCCGSCAADGCSDCTCKPANESCCSGSPGEWTDD
jgi:RNA polymerase sigma factor (sigma-70 family)